MYVTHRPGAPVDWPFAPVASAHHAVSVVAVTLVRSTAAVLQRLADLKEAHGSGCCGVVAFDGDGTLWSGDVSDDVFLRGWMACQEAGCKFRARLSTLRPVYLLFLC